MNTVVDNNQRSKTLPAFFRWCVKLWTSVITIGVTESQNNWIQKRTRLLNGICAIIIIINLIFIFSYLNPVYKITFWECFEMIVAYAVIILLNYFQKLDFACHAFLIYNVFNFSFQAVSHGPIDGVEYVLAINGICSMMFFKSIRIATIYLILNGLFFALCKYLFTVITPFLVMANGDSFYLQNHVLLFILPFLIIFYFRKENERQEGLLNNENTKLVSALYELKKTQQQLIQQEKLASLGQLTAGIAHEIKNPLNFVNNFADLSEEILDDLINAKTEEEKDAIIQELKDNLKRISDHGKRADRIVQSMMSHARSGVNEKQLTDINELCNESASLAYHGMRASINSFNCDFKIELSPDIPSLEIVRQDVGRVILNILNNAFYAINEKTKKSPPDYKPIVVLTTKLVNQSVLITIQDNGPGMPDAVLKNIFEPFYTTKPTGIGTGLGLSISYDIIQSHGGKIEVESVENKETQFTITLPFSLLP